MADRGWLDIREPRGTDDEALQAFFGIPPDPPESLDAHIAEKRQHWRATQMQGSKARDVSKVVLNNIKGAANKLKLGAPIVIESSPELVEQLTATVVPEAEFFDYARNLATTGKLAEALRLCELAKVKYPDSWVPYGAKGCIVEYGVRRQDIVRTDAIAAGLQDIETALSRNRTQPELWNASTSLLLYQRRYEDVLTSAKAAEAVLNAVPSGVTANSCLAHLGLGQVDEGLIMAAKAVHAVPDDLGLRGFLADGLIRQAAVPLLPLSDAKAQHRYRDVVATAAWCAQGLPELERLIRPHRLWAAKSETRIFSGSLRLRTLLAILTVFISPAIHNALKSKPAWQIYWQGPQGGDNFKILAGSPDVRQAHFGVPFPLSWEGADQVSS